MSDLVQNKSGVDWFGTVQFSLKLNCPALFGLFVTASKLPLSKRLELFWANILKQLIEIRIIINSNFKLL